jgi:hypothetical protein
VRVAAPYREEVVCEVGYVVQRVVIGHGDGLVVSHVAVVHHHDLSLQKIGWSGWESE